jgi:hypothetical protein
MMKVIVTYTNPCGLSRFHVVQLENLISHITGRKLRVLQNTELRRKSGSTRGSNSELEIFHNDGLHNLYFSRYVMGLVVQVKHDAPCTSGKNLWSEHLTQRVFFKYLIVDGKILKLIFAKLRARMSDWIHFAQDGVQGWSLLNKVTYLRVQSIKANFMAKYLFFLTKNSAPSSLW